MVLDYHTQGQKEASTSYVSMLLVYKVGAHLMFYTTFDCRNPHYYFSNLSFRLEHLYSSISNQFLPNPCFDIRFECNHFLAHLVHIPNEEFILVVRCFVLYLLFFMGFESQFYLCILAYFIYLCSDITLIRNQLHTHAW